jgi:uncharacterized protein (UPF0297 family)
MYRMKTRLMPKYSFVSTQTLRMGFGDIRNMIHTARVSSRLYFHKDIRVYVAVNHITVGYYVNGEFSYINN